MSIEKIFVYLLVFVIAWGIFKISYAYDHEEEDNEAFVRMQNPYWKIAVANFFAIASSFVLFVDAVIFIFQYNF